MQKDYILRIIEQFVQAIVSIIDLRKAGKSEEALEKIMKASQNYLGEDISFFLQFTPDSIVEYFKGNSKHLDAENCIICADLIHELALICDDNKNFQEGHYLKSLCLNLYATAITADSHFQNEEYFEKTNFLLNEIKGKPISEGMKVNIQKYKKAAAAERATA